MKLDPMVSLPTKKIQRPEGRIYVTEKGNVPSVTTVLQLYTVPAIDQWKNNLIAKGISPQERLQYTAIRGAYIHWGIADCLSREHFNKSLPPFEFEDSQTQLKFERIKEDENFMLEFERSMQILQLQWLYEHEVQPFEGGLEALVWSPKYLYAGTVDFIGLVDGKASIIDFKTSSNIYVKQQQQVAAYKQAALETYEVEIEKVGVVTFCPDFEYLGNPRNPKQEYTCKYNRKDFLPYFLSWRKKFKEIYSY